MPGCWSAGAPAPPGRPGPATFQGCSQSSNCDGADDNVDSYKGPGVFFQLRTLQPGNQIAVNLADGVIATFKVTSVVEYQKSAFPDQKVYGSNGSSELQLVTCGGTFDSQTGHYLSNIVVYSSFVSAT